MVVAVILVRIAVRPLSHTVFTTYATAGRHWLEGRNLYPTTNGFIYSPLAAAFFAPFSLLPPGLGNVAWRLLNLAVFLGAVATWLRSGIARIDAPRHALVFLLMLPLSIGNINNGQANPLMIGLIMGAVLAARTERWLAGALCVAVITFFKIYPLAVGLLLVVLFPRKFTWRLGLALLALGALSFVLQRPSYVLEQYHQWIATRTGDQRHYQPDIAPRDLWMLLRVFRIELDLRVYFVVQVLGGGAIAALCMYGRWRDWSTDRLLTALFCLVCCWMLLLGPSPESSTYIILAPAISLAMVEAFSSALPTRGCARCSPAPSPSSSRPSARIAT